MTTFGFEAEFQVGAAQVLAELFNRELAGDAVLHGYHCDCEHCEFDNDYAYRGQTDSSCSGEIISNVFRRLDDPPFGALAEAAVQVDAEPGMNAGFHVHVSCVDEDFEHLPHRDEALWQFIRWEHVLQRLAGGRWTDQRSGMNQTVRQRLAWTWHNQFCGKRFSTGNILAAEQDDLADSRFKLQLLRTLHEEDRHTNLNIRTRHNTWEFRLWNSTRVAWRMKMFCGVSVALLNPNVVECLGEAIPPQRLAQPATGLDTFAAALDSGGFGRTAELVMRQAAYLESQAMTAPQTLTIV